MPVNNDLRNIGSLLNAYQPLSAARTDQNRTAPEEERSGNPAQSPAYIVSLSGQVPSEESAPVQAAGETAKGQEPERFPAETSEKDAAKAEEDKEKRSGMAKEPWREGKSAAEQKEIEAQIQEMKRVENEVITHEHAHKATGGQYSGGISYEYASGPDGRRYIAGGEVSIDIGEESTPQQTILKMQVVRRAALAPADPSGQDKSVAAAASQIESSARQELNKEMMEKSLGAADKSSVADKAKAADNAAEVEAIGKTQRQQDDNNKTFKDAGARAQAPGVGGVVDLAA